jgi:hypothetical protein
MPGDDWSAEGLKARRYDIDGSREVAPQPTAGGAVPRIPVVNAEAVRDARRWIRTMHETKGDKRAGLATVRPGSIRDDAYPMVPALIADALPNPVITFPQIAYGPSPGGLFASRSRQSGMLSFR